MWTEDSKTIALSKTKICKYRWLLPLDSTDVSLHHILSGCKTTLTQRCYTWRYDQVLRKLADIYNNCLTAFIRVIVLYWSLDDPDEGHKPQTHWSDNKVFLYTTSVAGFFTSSDFFPLPCTLEVGKVVPEIPTLLLQGMKNNQEKESSKPVCQIRNMMTPISLSGLTISAARESCFSCVS